tara:strand:+ start:690 stop:1253 length:564 start_codon:yes stop_codon:yes gene_type:complete
VVSKILKNSWYFFEQAVSDDVCNKIIESAKSFDGGTVEENGVDESIRKSGVYFTNEQWLYDLVWPFMEQANKNGNWNYEISSAEDFQITRYLKGEFYSEHVDGCIDHSSIRYAPENKFLNGKVRKLSMTINLNDDYEGGELEINGETVQMKKGTIVFFPSFLKHQAKPVSRGNRFSLVAWFLGEPFR